MLILLIGYLFVNVVLHAKHRKNTSSQRPVMPAEVK